MRLPYLTPREIEGMTGLTQFAAQVKYLRRIGVRAERRNDGSVLVLREWLAERPAKAAQSRPELESTVSRRAQTAQAR